MLDLIQGHALAHEKAVVFDCTHHGRVEVQGPEAARFLHNLCTNEIVKLELGGGIEAFLTTGKAKIVGHVWIWRVGEDRFLLDCGPDQGSKCYTHLDRHLISEKLTLTENTQSTCQLHVVGPEAKRLLELQPGEPLKRVDLDPSWDEVTIFRRDWLGVPGLDMFAPIAKKQELQSRLERAGIAMAGESLRDVLRVEAGMPLYGVDFDEGNLPQEVDRMEQTVSFVKGCYIGQETVARTKTYGHVNRMLRKLKVEDAAPRQPDVEITCNGDAAGHLKSCVVSPSAGPIAIGLIKRNFTAAGTVLDGYTVL